MTERHRHHRHHRHLNSREFDREPVTHTYGGGFYVAPWDSGYYTAQNPHLASECADPTTCPAHAGDSTAVTGADAGVADAGATGGATGGGTV